MTAPVESEFTYVRKGTRTRVFRDGILLGWVTRKEGWNSSPRGGAYRTFHHPLTASGKRLGSCYTRKEAVEHLALIADQEATK